MITKRNDSYKLIMLGRQVLKWLIKNQAHFVELLLKYVRNVVTVTVVGPVHSFFTVLENFITTIMDDENNDDFSDFGINNQFQYYYYQASDPLYMSQDQNEQQQQQQQLPPHLPSLPQQQQQQHPNDELSKGYSLNGIKSLTNNLLGITLTTPICGSGSTSSSSLSSTTSSSSSLTTSIDLLDSSKLHELPKCHYSLNTFRERNANLLNSELMSDVRFIVGPTKKIVPAHKYVLATGSSVFYAMFYGTIAETGNEIEVPDVEPLAFLTLLRYLYCDDIRLEAEYVLATLYAAKKYLLPYLAKECVRFLKHNLTAKNACLLLCQSSLFEEHELMEQCWDVIDAQAEIALKAEGFVDIDLKTLELIYSRESLNCKEMTLLEVALNWADAECERRKLEPTPKNKREVLGKVLYLIRIPTMALDEFANQVAPLNIFTLEEVVDFFFHFTAIKKPCLTFSTKPRAGRKAQICNRFQSCAYRNNQWRYRGRCDSFQFMSDRRIFVIGFGLYGSSNGAADYKVKIELKRQEKCLSTKNSSFYSDGSSSTFHVFFEQPVQIDPDIFYTASAILDGNELSYFGQEGMTEISIGPVTFQFQSSHESTNGTGVQGGQIPELIYYGP